MTLKNDDIIRLIFIIFSIFFLFLLAPIIDLSSEKFALVLLGFVVTVGMSHGSLDWLLARHWGIRRNFIENLTFLLGYAMIVLLALSIWWHMPTIGLIIFLMMSILHFAKDWKDELSQPAMLVMGLAVVTLPGILFQHEVLALFSLLVPTPNAAMLSNSLHLAGYIGMIGGSLIALQQINKSPLLSAEIAGLIAVGLVLPPLVYFSLYFCVLHTTKHWVRMKRMGLYQQFSQALWSAVWPTALCIIVGIWVCHASTAWSFSQAFIRTVFIGLAALTVPHWLLLEIYPLFAKRESTCRA